METLEAIKSRTSVRAWEPRSIPSDIIRELLTAAFYAPSASNQQPWHIVVVDDRDVLTKAATLNPFGLMAARAPMGLLVCLDSELESSSGTGVQDCAAATQNILLAAHALGLGAVWTGVHPDPVRVESFSALFDLPRSVTPISFVLLGYSSHKPKPLDRNRWGRVHVNRW